MLPSQNDNETVSGATTLTVTAVPTPTPSTRTDMPGTERPENTSADIDLIAAASALKCPADEDAVCFAIDLLLNELDERNKKIAFFENLFGHSAEYLMACKDGLKKYSGAHFFGTKVLRGEALQKVMREELKKRWSLEQIGNRELQRKDEKYAVAVVLPLSVKTRVDAAQKIASAQVAQERKAAAQQKSASSAPKTSQDLNGQKFALENNNSDRDSVSPKKIFTLKAASEGLEKLATIDATEKKRKRPTAEDDQDKHCNERAKMSKLD
ncbi:hypothetical protein N0V90_009477 [Kalmusia sp. IMI 367209]|nr:hypothetical protein N0V90_009477 [Kalmusia sp. IMI 367209]